MIRTKNRIELSDTPLDAIVKLSEGNPGAVDVCLKLFQKGGDIDPDSAFGGFGAMLALDTHGIYGSRIWVLFKDVCGENIVRVLGLLRSVQLGQMPTLSLLNAIDGNRRPTHAEIDAIVDDVRKQLPAFGVAHIHAA